MLTYVSSRTTYYLGPYRPKQRGVAPTSHASQRLGTVENHGQAQSLCTGAFATNITREEIHLAESWKYAACVPGLLERLRAIEDEPLPGEDSSSDEEDGDDVEVGVKG